MEIYKILYLSAGHIKPETFKYLEEQSSKSQAVDVVAYRIESYLYLDGFFVLAEGYADDGGENLPRDLVECLEFALGNGCSWIRFDVDFEPLPELPVYKW